MDYLDQENKYCVNLFLTISLSVCLGALKITILGGTYEHQQLMFRIRNKTNTFQLPTLIYISGYIVQGWIQDFWKWGLYV